MAIEELSLQANGIHFHALADGPADGRLVLLLHGFPELARSWRMQLPALAAAGFRAVAPDMRGYGGTDKSGPFDVATLSRDVAGLVKALGREKAHIVGHDWGGGVAWGVASLQPQVVDKLTILNCPHPGVMVDEMTRNPRQLARSWYMFAFQLPVLPEYFMTRKRAVNVARGLKGGSVVRDHWTREELEHYRESFLQPGAATAAVGYYRAALRSPLKLRQELKAHPIAAPTCIIWGMGDRFLGRETIEPKKMAPYFAAGNVAEIRPIAGVGHFVQNEAPERVNEELVDWLGR